MNEIREQFVKDRMVYLSCIVPVFNEEETIDSFLQTLIQALQKITSRFEIIVVDDGSRDETVEKILPFTADSTVCLLSLSRNFGKEIALTAGLEHCRGDVALMMDADFQHPIEVLPIFLEKWALGYDMVYGVRRNRNTDSRWRRRLTHLFYWLMTKLSRIDMPENAGDFRLLDRKVINALNVIPERTRFMKGLYGWVGFRKIAVPFDVQQRAAGKSRWGLMHLAELALIGITSFSDIPLRVWGFVGFLVSLISMIYAIYIVTVTLLYGTDLPGFPSIIVAVMFFGGIQLLSIGILGEYIARIFTEVKRRPKYIVAMKAGFDVDGLT